MNQKSKHPNIRFKVFSPKDGSTSFWKFAPTLVEDYVWVYYSNETCELRDMFATKRSSIPAIIESARQSGLEVTEVADEIT